ncbi:hypothetical protein IB239_01880 [Pseudomonas sp. PDM12]|uniref:hypothetical protein n=1 Tax=Pseudomonas sp. PDM12 TaxID=2769260 RepID=UPI00177B0852|nr:hypothetical protein [Pseudomonas sp. PDM12]MBD9653560.1 hypothetical protein [Pseudomonas sp. PDM12]
MAITTLFACLLTAGLTVSLTLWLTSDDTPSIPNVYIPERLADQIGDHLLLQGGWITEEGHQPPGHSAVEIRCYPEQQLCSEAVATIFHHTEGSDLEAQTYLYKVTDWTDARIQAVAVGAMGECHERRLHLYLRDIDARLEWGPGEGCEGDSGSALLIGEVWAD